MAPHYLQIASIKLRKRHPLYVISVALRAIAMALTLTAYFNVEALEDSNQS